MTESLLNFRRKKAADKFFTENISSLLDSISVVERIELKRKFSHQLMEEKITAVLKTDRPQIDDQP